MEENMKKLLLGALIFISAFAAFSKAGDKKYVAVKETQLRDKASVLAKKSAEVKYGQQITVVKEEKNWVLAKTQEGKSGWIPENALTKKKVLLDSKVTASSQEIALAGKGFGEEDEELFKKDSNANYGAVDAMENRTVTEKELKSFLKDGNLNPE